MKTNATLREISDAIITVNEKYGYRIKIKELKHISSKTIQFTIRSEKSGIAGACYSYSGRKSVAASWHAHGYLFDELIKLRGDIFISTGQSKITKDGGNWKDFNVGSLMYPTMASELSIL